MREAEVCEIKRDLGEPIARIWKEGMASWWVELWTPLAAHEAPLEDGFLIEGMPEPIKGYACHATAFCGTRRSARRKGYEMKRRWLEGHPEKEPRGYEIL